MKRRFAKFKRWWCRRGDLAYLARVKAEGQTWFIIRGTLAIGLATMLLYDFFDGRLGLNAIVLGHLNGLIASWVGWRDIEGRYQKALSEARQKGILTPTDLLGLKDS